MPQDPLHLVCVEPRFPGRLGAVADWLVRRRGYRVRFFCQKATPVETWPESSGRGLEVIPFKVGGVAKESSVGWKRALERGLCYAYGCWEVLEAKKPKPVDVFLGRSDGLGSSLYVPTYLPRTPIVQFFDYYHHARAHDLAPEIGPRMPPAYFHWRRAANAVDLLDLENATLPWTPSAWQRDLFPPEYRDDFLVLPDGVDARAFAPKADRPRVIGGRAIPEGMKVVSFVSKGLDRLRGFDRFLKLANALIRDRPDVIAVAVGDGRIQRGLDVEYFGKDFGAIALASDPSADPDRLWLLGTVPPPTVAEVLGASDLHVYPGRPYPVSRSLFQAMAAACPILAVDSDPVEQAIRAGVDGLLAPADDPDAWVGQARRVLDDPEGHRATLGASAREIVLSRYSQDVTLPKLAERFNALAGLGG